jgi:acetate CoA/acetoacetate CoA-transferase beta subunit
MENIREYIAARAAREISDGEVINVGIGLPTFVLSYLPKTITVISQNENGVINARPSNPLERDLHYQNASGELIVAQPGGSFFDSATSFAMIRGAHIDCTILGSLEVDQEGNLANWIIPGKLVPGMGGAMDLVIGAKRVIVAMEHTNKGSPKIRVRCTLPLTATTCVNRIITEMGVIDVTKEGLVLVEYNPLFSLEEIQDNTEAKLILSPHLIPDPFVSLG